MSLNWDVSKIANKDSVCWVEVDGEKRLSGTTETLILISPAVGLGNLTEDNWRKWYERVRALEAISGPFRTVRRNPNEIESIYFSIDEIRQHIGLTTNVADEFDAQFYKRLRLMNQDRAGLEIRDWEKKTEPVGSESA